MKSLLILGAGGFGQMAKEMALELGYERVVFLDDAADGEDVIGRCCDYALWHKPVDKKCPKCDSLLVVKGKKNEIQCPNKECDYKEE